MEEEVFSYTLPENKTVFYFSSRIHCRKFIESVTRSDNTPVNQSLIRRFGLPGIEYCYLELIQLYRRIETAGFRIRLNTGEVVTCPENLVFMDLVQIRR